MARPMSEPVPPALTAQDTRPEVLYLATKTSLLAPPESVKPSKRADPWQEPVM